MGVVDERPGNEIATASTSSRLELLDRRATSPSFRDDNVAVAIDALGNSETPVLWHDRRVGLVQMRLMDHLALGTAGDLLRRLADEDGVLVPTGRDQRRAYPLALDDGVGGDGAAVNEEAAAGQQRRGIDTQVAGRRRHRLEDATVADRRAGSATWRW